MPSLRMENVSKTFGIGTTAVRAVTDISLVAEPGEVLLIMGPSGSGKTTLLAMAGCLTQPDQGRIWVGDQEITALKQNQLPAVRRERVGFIFQAFHLLGALTALENVELVLNLARKNRSPGQAERLLAELGLESRLNFLPAQLSGGERQRVAIARALAADPTLILADEPTANLDSRSGHLVAGLLAQAARERGKAVIIVSHDNRLKEVADRIIWMEDGKLARDAATA